MVAGPPLRLTWLGFCGSVVCSPDSGALHFGRGTLTDSETLSIKAYLRVQTHKDLYSRRVIVGFAYKFSRRIFEFGHRHQKRMPLDSMGKEDEETLLTSVNEKTILKSELVDEKYADQQITQKLSFWRMWTVNVLLTLSTQAMFEFHLGFALPSDILWCFPGS